MNTPTPYNNDQLTWIYSPTNVLEIKYLKCPRWAAQLAMESTANFDNVIDEIIDGPSNIGTTAWDFFEWNGIRYYDNYLTAKWKPCIGLHPDPGAGDVGQPQDLSIGT
ncbi:hypothetical protein BYT27DRAFT_7250292 [Phlegmacium glaucopus]|nr:hypothetical protein BYT27DRAFT_7250292 [Phlegmacium glaucopus]